MMMKMKVKYLTLAAALLALAGCNKEPAADGGAIIVDATLGAATKVSAAGDAFTSGDQIAVYAWLGSATQMPDTRVVDGVVNTFNGTSWTPATMMLWQLTDAPHYFLGISPAQTATISDFTAVPYTITGSAATDDLLLATTPAGVKNTGVAVPLAFTHAMARLDVNIRFRNEWDTAPEATRVKVLVEAKGGATVNYLTKTVTATGATANVALAPATAATGYHLGYSGLQVPQSGVMKIIVEVDGLEYGFTSASGIPLIGGKYTTLNLLVGRDRIELAGISLAPWTSESPQDEGEVVSANRYMGHGYVDMGEVTIGGEKMNLLWATCNIGAENPWDYGDYYAWGEKATKDYYSWGNYAFMQEGKYDWKHVTKYTVADGKTDGIWYDGGNFIGDGRTSFSDFYYIDDAAHQLWGGNWHIPTDEEWTALYDGTFYKWEWTDDYLGDGSNHAGRIVTRKDGTGPCSGNSIFLPAAGCRDDFNLDDAGAEGFYWVSSIKGSRSNEAGFVCFDSDGVNGLYVDRYYGFSLRPVYFERYPVAAADVAPKDVGRVLAADGNIYADAVTADAFGGGAQAVIAYVGSVPNYFDKFLAIAIDNANGNGIVFADALTKVDEYAAAHPITIGGTTYDNNAVGDTCYDIVKNNQTISSATHTTGVVKGWRMPSATDWRYIFEGFGGPTVASQPAGVQDDMAYGNGPNLRNAINAACGNISLRTLAYWSSSEESYSNFFVCSYRFATSDFVFIGKESFACVRPVFAY